MAAQIGRDASFANHERTVLAAANEVCRVVLAATLQATALNEFLGNVRGGRPAGSMQR